MLPLASRSSPPRTSTENRSRSGLTIAFFTVGNGVAAAFDVHRVAHARLSLLDLVQLLARGSLDHEGGANPERLAVDLEHAVPAAGVDPVVVPYGEHLLTQLILGAPRFVTTFLS